MFSAVVMSLDPAGIAQLPCVCLCCIECINVKDCGTRDIKALSFVRVELCMYMYSIFYALAVLAYFYGSTVLIPL